MAGINSPFQARVFYLRGAAQDIEEWSALVSCARVLCMCVVHVCVCVPLCVCVCVYVLVSG